MDTLSSGKSERATRTEGGSEREERREGGRDEGVRKGGGRERDTLKIYLASQLIDNENLGWVEATEECYHCMFGFVREANQCRSNR